jgi:hypothetical protein
LEEIVIYFICNENNHAISLSGFFFFFTFFNFYFNTHCSFSCNARKLATTLLNFAYFEGVNELHTQNISIKGKLSTIHFSVRTGAAAIKHLSSFSLFKAKTLLYCI